jgi:hypothetical protein
MDEIGQRYQALALRIGRHVPDYVDFWTGDARLREAIAGEGPSPPVELHVEAISLHEACAALPADDAAAARRREWLLAQLGAMSGIARRLGGEEIAFADLVEVLFDVPVAETPESDVRRAHAVLNDVLPPGATLQSRLAAHDAATRIPPEKTVAAVEWLAGELRDRTRLQLGLPEGESVEVVAVRKKPWGASAPYLGGLRTRIEVNLDLAFTLGTVIYLAAHETYPGHHTERASKEVALWRDRELGEAAVACLFTPEIAVSEGLADEGRAVVLTDQEVGGVLRDLARQLELPIAAADVEREVFVGSGRDLLRDLTADAALALHQQGLPEADVREMLAERALRTAERIEHDFQMLRDPLWATYAFAYATGPRLISPWLEAQGQTTGFGRLLREQLSPGQLRAELGEPLPLFPGSLV